MCSMSLTVVVSARSKGRHDAPRHLVGRQSGVLPNDADDRNADFGEYIDRRAHCRQTAGDQNEQRQDDERVGQPQRDANECSHES